MFGGIAVHIDWGRAVVDPSKIRDYLLSDSHPVGRFKAAWFRLLGFTDRDWPALSGALLAGSAVGIADVGDRNAFGQKYLVEVTLNGPAGRSGSVTAVWIVLDGEDFPRFVTAYPARR